MIAAGANSGNFTGRTRESSDARLAIEIGRTRRGGTSRAGTYAARHAGLDSARRAFQNIGAQPSGDAMAPPPPPRRAPAGAMGPPPSRAPPRGRTWSPPRTRAWARATPRRWRSNLGTADARRTALALLALTPLGGRRHPGPPARSLAGADSHRSRRRANPPRRRRARRGGARARERAEGRPEVGGCRDASRRRRRRQGRAPARREESGSGGGGARGGRRGRAAAFDVWTRSGGRGRRASRRIGARFAAGAAEPSFSSLRPSRVSAAANAAIADVLSGAVRGVPEPALWSEVERPPLFDRLPPPKPPPRLIPRPPAVSLAERRAEMAAKATARASEKDEDDRHAHVTAEAARRDLVAEAQRDEAARVAKMLERRIALDAQAKRDRERRAGRAGRAVRRAAGEGHRPAGRAGRGGKG